MEYSMNYLYKKYNNINHNIHCLLNMHQKQHQIYYEINFYYGHEKIIQCKVFQDSRWSCILLMLEFLKKLSNLGTSAKTIANITDVRMATPKSPIDCDEVRGSSADISFLFDDDNCCLSIYKFLFIFSIISSISVEFLKLLHSFSVHVHSSVVVVTIQNKIYIVFNKLYYTALVLFEQSKCVDCIFLCHIQSLTRYHFSSWIFK